MLKVFILPDTKFRIEDSIAYVSYSDLHSKRIHAILASNEIELVYMEISKGIDMSLVIDLVKHAKVYTMIVKDFDLTNMHEFLIKIEPDLKAEVSRCKRTGRSLKAIFESLQSKGVVVLV